VPDHFSMALSQMMRVLGLFSMRIWLVLSGAQAIAPVNERNLGREIGEEERFLHRRVAAADHDNFLAFEKEAVARGASRHAEAFELFFARQPPAILPERLSR
jgi:hypothetical protein